MRSKVTFLAYYVFLRHQRANIFPAEFIDSYEFDIKEYPQKYMKYMIYMCLEIEKLGTKSFQFFPLRTNVVPKFIPIDTNTLIYLYLTSSLNNPH